MIYPQTRNASWPAIITSASHHESSVSARAVAIIHALTHALRSQVAISCLLGAVPWYKLLKYPTSNSQLAPSCLVHIRCSSRRWTQSLPVKSALSYITTIQLNALLQGTWKTLNPAPVPRIPRLLKTWHLNSTDFCARYHSVTVYRMQEKYSALYRINKSIIRNTEIMNR